MSLHYWRKRPPTNEGQTALYIFNLITVRYFKPNDELYRCVSTMCEDDQISITLDWWLVAGTASSTRGRPAHCEACSFKFSVHLHYRNYSIMITHASPTDPFPCRVRRVPRRRKRRRRRQRRTLSEASAAGAETQMTIRLWRGALKYLLDLLVALFFCFFTRLFPDVCGRPLQTFAFCK